jgi:hypothetical protein
MTLPEWTLLIGSVLSIGLAAGPWMIKVHAKLAVIASKLVDVCDKMDLAADEQRRLWEMCARHESRLDTHDVQLTHISERLRDAS